MGARLGSYEGIVVKMRFHNSAEFTLTLAAWPGASRRTGVPPQRTLACVRVYKGLGFSLGYAHFHVSISHLLRMQFERAPFARMIR